jgi:hypothetical protein
MSKRTPRKPKVHPIRQQNEPETPFDSPVAVEDPPEQPEAAPQEPQAPILPPPRPSFKKHDPPGKHMTFFDRVAAIQLADWGTRAKVKVYRLDPIIDRTRGSEYKFVQIYHQPIDEDKLKVDHGSGRYRLYLNIKSAGDKNEKEADTVEIDILDPKFPPNIPAGEWVDDPRNKKWAWARPAGAAGGPPLPEVPTPAATAAVAANQFLEGVKVAGEIRKQVKEETPPAPLATATGDPIESGLKIAQLFMTMKADNPMVEIMKEQLKAQNEANERARDREAALQKELRELTLRPRQGDAAEKKFGLREALGELKEFMPAIKEIIPEVAARSGRTSWLDVAREVAPGVIDWGGRIALAMASRMPPPPQGQPGQPPAQIAAPQNGQQPQQQPQQPPPQEVPAFFRYLGQPAVFGAFQRYFANFKAGEETGGADFANWIYDGGGADPLKQARAVGSAAIMQSLKSSSAWVLFQADEAKLSEFIDNALAWNPDEAPPAEDGDDDDDDNVDLTKKGV